MTVTVSSFRSQYPEFTDPADYPDAAITLHLSVATGMLDPDRWGTQLDLGLGLWIAHFLVLGRRDQIAAASGGVPGSLQGVLTSKTVDKVSASYDGQSIALSNMGFWGLSAYGLRLLQFARMFGAGGMQFGSYLN